MCEHNGDVHLALRMMWLIIFGYHCAPLGTLDLPAIDESRCKDALTRLEPLRATKGGCSDCLRT